MLSGCDWWISIRSLNNMQDWRKFWKRFRGCFVFQSRVSTKTVVTHFIRNKFDAHFFTPMSLLSQIQMHRDVFKVDSVPHALGWQDLLGSAKNVDKFCLHHVWNLVNAHGLENSKIFDRKVSFTLKSNTCYEDGTCLFQPFPLFSVCFRWVLNALGMLRFHFYQQLYLNSAGLNILPIHDYFYLEVQLKRRFANRGGCTEWHSTPLGRKIGR